MRRVYALKTLAIIKTALAVITREIRGHLGVDRAVIIFGSLLVLFAAPLIPRATHDARMLATFVVHESILTMALDAMTVWPLGDPSNLFEDCTRVPDYWHNFRCGSFFYYGGTYYDIAFLFLGPLKLMGFPTFPVAPIILRAVSLVAGLLSCVILYNFGRKHWGKWAGILGVFMLLTDSGFRFYATIIHPDTLQLLVALVVLVLAVRHTEEGDLASLLAAGLFAGVFHGVKFGGPWIIPMLVLAMYWGWKADSRKTSGNRPIGPATRLLCVAGAFGVGFFLSTPYALIPSNYYWKALKKIHLELSVSSVSPVNFWSWIGAIIEHRGIGPAMTMFVTVCTVIVSSFRGDSDKALVLAALLAACNIMWYSLMGKLYVVPAYFIPAYGLAGVLLGHYIAHFLNFIAHYSSGLAKPAYCLAMLCFIPMGAKQFTLALERFLTEWNYEQSTCMEIGRWAASHIPPGSSILMDRSAYFSPVLFPKQRLMGETVRYLDVLRTKCDYLLLSSAVYDSPDYAALRDDRHDVLLDSNPFSMHLYKALRCYDPRPSFPRPTVIPGIELLHVFQSCEFRKQVANNLVSHGYGSASGTSEELSGAGAHAATRGESENKKAFFSALCCGLKNELAKIKTDINAIGQLLKTVSKREQPAWGPRLHLFKVDQDKMREQGPALISGCELLCH